MKFLLTILTISTVFLSTTVAALTPAEQCQKQFPPGTPALSNCLKQLNQAAPVKPAPAPLVAVPPPKPAPAPVAVAPPPKLQVQAQVAQPAPKVQPIQQAPLQPSIAPQPARPATATAQLQPAPTVKPAIVLPSKTSTPQPTLTPATFLNPPAKSKSNFAAGYCTYGVDELKGLKINWSGNAKDWLANAKAKGYVTGSESKPGAIVVWGGTPVNGGYGHVGVVQADGRTYKAMNDYSDTTKKVELGKYVVRDIAGYPNRGNPSRPIGYIYFDQGFLTK